jgi:acyl carrier protein
MELNRVRERLRTLMEAHFPLARCFTDDDHLLERGIIDSLGILEVVSFVEQEFKLSISDEDLVPDNFRSIASLATFVVSKTGELNR